MDRLFTNVGARLKAFAKGYFKVTTWLLIIGGVIAFVALIAEEYTAPYAFGVLIGVPVTILSNLLFCWILHAFGSIAEKHEDGEPNSAQEEYEPPKANNNRFAFTERPSSQETREEEDTMFKTSMVVVAVVVGVFVVLLVLVGVLS